jgi:hypothetical protein
MKRDDKVFCPSCSEEMEVGFKEDFDEIFCKIIFSNNGEKEFAVCFCEKCDIMEVPLLTE